MEKKNNGFLKFFYNKLWLFIVCVMERQKVLIWKLLFRAFAILKIPEYSSDKIYTMTLFRIIVNVVGFPYTPVFQLTRPKIGSVNRFLKKIIFSRKSFKSHLIIYCKQNFFIIKTNKLIVKLKKGVH